MIRLNTLAPRQGEKKDAVRIGRGPGSGSGKTSGRGHKGQRARSGSRYSHEGGQMPLYRRLPKRGFNALDQSRIRVLNISFFEEKKDTLPSEVTLSYMKTQGWIRSSDKGVKILGSGMLSFPLKIEATDISSQARRTIESLGGNITLTQS